MELAREQSAAVLSVPAIVLAEENKIRQVVTNLIGNAMRFTPDDSPIELGVQVDPKRQVAMLDVIDHGEGIPPQIREKIFQRFWRADTSRTRETGGSGLGLAIVSAIVAAHKGAVDGARDAGRRRDLPGHPSPPPPAVAAAPSPQLRRSPHAARERCLVSSTAPDIPSRMLAADPASTTEEP